MIGVEPKVGQIYTLIIQQVKLLEIISYGWEGTVKVQNLHGEIFRCPILLLSPSYMTAEMFDQMVKQ